ncbi:DPP IV N-terminal domain-containing protein [Acidobacteriota bacterium]
MIRTFRTIILICLFLLLVFPAVSQEEEPLRGKALYKKLSTDRGLIKFEGERSLVWTPCGKFHYKYEEGTFVKYDIETGEKSSLFDDSRLIEAYNKAAMTSDEILPFKIFRFLSEGKKIRFMVKNRAFIYDLEDDSIITYLPQTEYRGVRGRMYGEILSLNLKYRAYIQDYNLYIKDMEERETALTTDGHKDLRNAYPDWVYPEELGQYQAYWWSPDSTRIAFMQFDESPVAKYPIVHDIAAKPELEMQSYPKSGANNPIVRLFIVDIKSKKITRIQTGMETNVYLFRGQWTPDGKEFTYQRMNRWQNKLELFGTDPATGKTRLILTDEDPCYVESGNDLTFLSDNKHLLWTSERSGWNEIYLYELSGKLVKPLTDSKLPIGSIMGVDEDNGWIYFSGQEDRGRESHVYRVNLDGKKFARLTKEPGSHRGSFSPNMVYFIDNFSSFTVPTQVTLRRADGQSVKVLGKSTVTEELKSFELIEPENFTFKSADGKYELDGHLFFPAHFDKNESYPLIMSVYGGPGSKQARNRFMLNDGRQALAQLGFVVASVDYRGASGRGKAFQNLMYLNLGEFELDDHAAGVKYLAQRPYIDGDRVGIYGHSYGGYLTCIALLKAPDVFHVGVAGAPVTDWRNYDSIYTERYMRRPQDNPEGYDMGSCMTYAKDLKGHLAIHHGAVDDNVHPGNSIQLIYALLRAGKKFDFMFYPEQRHGIRFSQYGEARIDYFLKHLKPVAK